MKSLISVLTKGLGGVAGEVATQVLEWLFNKLLRLMADNKVLREDNAEQKKIISEAEATKKALHEKIEKLKHASTTAEQEAAVDDLFAAAARRR